MCPGTSTGLPIVRFHHMRKLLRWAPVLGAIGLAFVAGFVPLSLYSLGPGPAIEVLPLIAVEGPTTYPSSGRLVMTTVEFRQLTAVGAAFAWLDPRVAVLTEEELFPGGESPEQEERRAISQMDTSKIDASSVVLRELGDYPSERGKGALIREVLAGCPAEGDLFPGDVILSVNGRPVAGAAASRRAIDGVPPQGTVRFEIRPLGQVKAQLFSLQRGRCIEDERPLLGISTIDAFPYEIAMRSREVGGPSAGLMWGLGLYDLLTPGDLTDGRTIAGTGVITPDGSVLPIGGIEEKVVAAQEAGAQAVLVPRDNMVEARAAGGDGVQLVAVATFQDALDYLEGGGDEA
jgi:PDZ domain-containing protein